MSDEATTATSGDSATGLDKDFLETTIRAIVDHPEDVIVDRSVDDLGVLLKLRVNEEDMSKVVGKGGQTAKSLRTLLRLVGSKFDQRVNLKILEPDGSEHRSEKPEVPRTAPAAPVEKKPIAEPKPAAPKAAAESKEGEEASGAFDNVI